MRLDREFRRLPLRLDTARLAAEALQFTEEEWRAHPQGHAGNTAIPLVSARGEINDEVGGPMRPTPFLARCPYLQQVLEALGTVIGRARLMRIAGESDATAHVDSSYYWRHHVRVHIPAVTYPEVQFLCGDKSVHMAAGEAWIFDTWKVHNVINPKSAPRIHFVADTVGSPYFWEELMAEPKAKRAKSKQIDVPFQPERPAQLAFESENVPVVMTPWEQQSLAAEMFHDIQPGDAAKAAPLQERTQTLHRQWHGLWAEHGVRPEGWEKFRAAMVQYDRDLEAWRKRIGLVNGMDLVEALRHAIVRPSVTTTLAAPADLAPAAAAPAIVENTPVDLASVHTSNFPGLLTELGISLLVTTYQAGRLIIVREQGGTLNTHFRTFLGPMGLAYDGLRLAIGTRREIWHFVNQAEVAPKLPPAGTHDAAFLPRGSHHTGDIRIHELAFCGDELWAVNTRFSCLCTFDAQHSFVPRWRPPFVSALAPDDRCHLNGLAVENGAVAYVTCHGLSDGPGGWREKKAAGGCLLHVPSGEVVASELSMPHSPRVYNGYLWLLESGHGTLCRIDPSTGERRVIVRLPGFTRGLDFYGPYAFIGLSQVRETAIFAGLPLTEQLTENERTCGVWVVDLRIGEVAAFLRFEAGVQEIFALQILPGIRQPDVTTDDEEVLASSFVVPAASLADVPTALVTTPQPPQDEHSTLVSTTALTPKRKAKPKRKR